MPQQSRYRLLPLDDEPPAPDPKLAAAADALVPPSRPITLPRGMMADPSIGLAAHDDPEGTAKTWLPIMLGTGAAVATGGASIPVQMATEGAAAGAGTALTGGTPDEALTSALYAAALGGAGGLAGKGIDRLRLALKLGKPSAAAYKAAGEAAIGANQAGRVERTLKQMEDIPVITDQTVDTGLISPYKNAAGQYPPITRTSSTMHSVPSPTKQAIQQRAEDLSLIERAGLAEPADPTVPGRLGPRVPATDAAPGALDLIRERWPVAAGGAVGIEAIRRLVGALFGPSSPAPRR